jgi:hypothetical protein
MRASWSTFPSRCSSRALLDLGLAVGAASARRPAVAPRRRRAQPTGSSVCRFIDRRPRSAVFRARAVPLKRASRVRRCAGPLPSI